jgi:hypothetical protein
MRRAHTSIDRSGPSRRRRGLIAALAALACAALIAGVVWGFGAEAHGPQRGPGPAARADPAARSIRGEPATVVVQPSHPGAQVPKNFLGLSFEVAALSRIAKLGRGGSLVRLLRSLGGGTVRFGGVSADTQITWAPKGSRGAHTVSAHDLAGIAALARHTGWSVLLTVNLGHFDPRKAAEEAAAARSLLGPRLAGIEIGNEPDRFGYKGLRGGAWKFSRYAPQFEAYRSAIAHAAPGVPIVGPDASSGPVPLPWVQAEAGLHPALLTDHYYPLSKCGSAPTVGELLSPAVRSKELSILRQLGVIQRSSGIPLQLDESNNISCKGQPGVSNTFASALWAADYIPRAMAAGVRGLDFHDLLSLPGAYSPLIEVAGRLHANPEWYALLLTRGLDGTRALPTSVYSSSALTARAFLAPDGSVRVALANFDPPGAKPLRVSLRIPGRFARGTILRLTAPSPNVTSHVTLGGTEVTPSGAWRPRLPLPRAYDAHGSLAVAMPPNSAALVTLEPAAVAPHGAGA